MVVTLLITIKHKKFAELLSFSFFPSKLWVNSIFKSRKFFSKIKFFKLPRGRQKLETNNNNKNKFHGWEPWSSGYGRRLTFWRSWVRIPVLYTGWKFFSLICWKIVLMFVWKRPKKTNRGRGWPILKKALWTCFWPADGASRGGQRSSVRIHWAHWIPLLLPSWRPGFKSQRCFQVIFELCVKRTKINLLTLIWIVCLRFVC